MIPKFRAWHKPTQLMDDVVLIDFYNEKIGILYADPVIQGESIQKYNFNEIVLMQSTGLEDKNGVEIFEGDIVKVHRFQQGHVGGNYGVVEVEEEMVCVVEKATVEHYIYPCEWFLVDVYDEEPENLWLSSGLHEESYEVIGNIFENESLLKELE